MGIAQLTQNISKKPAIGRLLGIDQGDKRIGLAISDPLQSIATPLQTVDKTKFSKYILEIKKVFDEYEVKGLVIGYPLNMDGSEGPRCNAVRDFAQNIYDRKDLFGEDLWISLWDERLTTSAVNDFLIDEVDMNRKRRKQVVDKMAAQLILQGALDYSSR